MLASRSLRAGIYRAFGESPLPEPSASERGTSHLLSSERMYFLDWGPQATSNLHPEPFSGLRKPSWTLGMAWRGSANQVVEAGGGLVKQEACVRN